MNLVCPHCLAINRIPEERLGDDPKCGKCKSSLIPAAPINATDANFARHISKNDLPVIVDFWASWCGPCIQFAPAFEAVAAQMSQQARFVKVSTEDNQATAAQYAIRSIPTLMAFKNGVEVDRLSGALPQAQFTQWVQQFIG